jgi:hypothetical protein
MLLVYFMEDTNVNKRFMMELITWRLRAKISEQDKNAI